MKILIKRYNGEFYVWKKATWNGACYVLDNRDEICENQILAVTEDERIGYVRCSHCGTLVKNNAESIEAHYAELESKKDCMSCDKMAIDGRKRNATRKIKKNEDGTYSIEETYNADLVCRAGYYTEYIDSASAARNCKFTLCRRKGVKPINDTFVKYPGLFERQITVDVLNAKKYPFEKYSNGYYEYDLKMRGTVKACVNHNGIVEHFLVYSRGWSTMLYYSDKYKKLFFADWGRYNDNISDVLTSAKEEKLIEKISQLYEEENANE